MELSFESIKYGSYPQNSGFGNFPIVYKQRLLTKRPIDNLTDNKVEELKVSTIKLLLDNRGYQSNPRNANFDGLPFDGDEKLINRG